MPLVEDCNDSIDVQLIKCYTTREIRIAHSAIVPAIALSDTFLQSPTIKPAPANIPANATKPVKLLPTSQPDSSPANPTSATTSPTRVETMNSDSKNFSVALDRSRKSSHINRRSALRALGVSLALPSLQLMTPTSLRASNDLVSPVRLAWVFFPNGTNAERWFPKGKGTEWEFSPSLAPLAENRLDLNVLKGLAN